MDKQQEIDNAVDLVFACVMDSDREGLIRRVDELRTLLDDNMSITPLQFIQFSRYEINLFLRNFLDMTGERSDG